MAFKVGDKFIVEIESVDTDECGKESYKIKGFQKLHFSEFKLRNLERVTDEDHILEVGDIVYHPISDGKYIIINIKTFPDGEPLYMVMSCLNGTVMENVEAKELNFTGDNVDLSKTFKRYK